MSSEEGFMAALLEWAYWLEETAPALWVGESLWAYPMWLGMHVTGLAIVVGLFTMRDLRLLGLFKDVAPEAFVSISRIAWFGFVINAVSGLFLFSSQASAFVENIPFWFKISCIFAGFVVALIIQGRIKREYVGGGSDVAIPVSTKLLAASSLLFWVLATTNGRVIAYFL